LEGGASDCGTCSLLVFVTDSGVNAYDLAALGVGSGLTGADEFCSNQARAASLPGTYKAWLSSSTSSVASRFTHGAVPYVMVDGTHIAENWSDLTDGSLEAPITRNASGEDMGVGGVWTATSPSGEISYSNNTCFDWTYGGSNVSGADGYMGASHGDWSLNSVQPLDTCDKRSRLYCFQQPDGPVPPTTTTTLPGPQPCEATEPTCNGVCPAGQVCAASIDAPFDCGCYALPAACGDTYPTCNGTCPPGELCTDFGGTVQYCTCYSPF